MAARRVNGPYQHGIRYRIHIIDGDGTQVAESYGTREAAEAAKANYLRIADERTIGGAIEEYLAQMRARGLRDGTINTAGYRLRAILRVDSHGTGDRLLAVLTPTAARALYARRAQEVKPDTHQGELTIAGQAADWWVKMSWLRRNPFEGCDPVGRRSAGKPQLRVDEARRFLGLCLTEASPASLAAALALLGGLRASEVIDRVVRDLDDGGRLLWIPHSKTRAGIRQLMIPAVLQAPLLSLVGNKGPDERIWNLSRHALHHHVVRLCTAAGVQRVTPHGLRGLHATIGVGTGVALEHVARALGHSDVSVTRRHYLTPGIEEQAATHRMIDLLTGTTAHAPGDFRQHYLVTGGESVITSEAEHPVEDG